MRKKKKYSHDHSIEKSQIEAANLLATGHYKEAIDAYKRLLKKEQRQEWQKALAQAYSQRAQALANKNMYKEAAVLWENRANLCEDKELFEQYIYWLICAGYHVKAASLFLKSGEHLSNEAARLLLVRFGALLLAGYQEVAEIFPKDAPLLKQYALVKQALEAYYQGDDKTSENALTQISFRSPYRDFRLILKALLIIDSDPKSANQLLEKVHTDSPYAHFAQLIQIGCQDGKFLLESLDKLTSFEQSFIAGLKGWDKTQLKVISALYIATKQNSYKALMEVVVANRPFFGDLYARQFCLALLPSYPVGMKFYEKIFGTLSVFEKNRIIALNHEQQGQSLPADRHWRFCINYLRQNLKQEDNALKIALILRHLVELADKRGEMFDDEDVPNDLAESIYLDPDDKTSYLKLIQWYKHQDAQKNYHKWVDATVKHFPKESDVLLIAMEAATGKKAFKKAVRFAKTLLKVDPINMKARQIARSSHVSHARKLIKAGRYTLARKELEQAAQFEKNKQSSGIVQINQALLELQVEGILKPTLKTRKSRATKQDLLSQEVNTQKSKSKNLKKITKLLQEGIQFAGGGIVGHFKVIIESRSQNYEPANILSLLPERNKRFLPTRYEILELIKLINVYSEEDITFLLEALEPLTESLEKATKLDFSQEEMLSICQCFKKVEYHGLLKKFAVQALKQWPERPAFIFYQIYGKAKGNVWVMPMPDMERLKQAAETAEREGDKRTTMMIMGFLNQMGGGMLPPPFFNPFDYDEDDFDHSDDLDDLEDSLEALEKMNLEDITPAEVIKILNRLEEMGIEIPDFGLPFPRIPHKKKPTKK